MRTQALAETPAGALDRRRRLLVLATCCASIVVVVMDISIVNVALPVLRHDLDASVSDLQWTVDAYTLVLAGFLVLAGSTADRVGRRRVFRVGLVAFGAGSLLCALAPSIGFLIAARALQAVGGTMLNPVAMAIVAATFTEPAERARAIGVFGSMAGLSLAHGSDPGRRAGRRHRLARRLLDQCADRDRGARGHGALRPGVARAAGAPARPGGSAPGGRWSWAASSTRSSSPRGWAGARRSSPALVLAALLGLLGLIGYERRRDDPLLDLRMFRSVPFTSAILMALFALCGFGAFLFTTTLYLQDVRGLSAMATGLCLLPVGVLVIVLSPLTGRAGGRPWFATPAGRRRDLDGDGGRRGCRARAVHAAGGRGGVVPVLRRLPGHRQPADHLHGRLRHAHVDGRSGGISGLGRSADRHHVGHRDRRSDPGRCRCRRRDRLRRGRPRRVVDGGRSRDRHPRSGVAQHRGPGAGQCRARRQLCSRMPNLVRRR